jgi:hypothetical protein
MGKREGRVPPGYLARCERLSELIPKWIEEKSQQRFLDLRWKRWGRTVYAGPLGGKWANWLADSPDALELLNWLDEQTGKQATLLQALVVLERLGIKAREDDSN